MPDVEINDLGLGAARDIPGYQLPPEAWTFAMNMRAASDGMESIRGQEQVFGTPGVTPHFAIPILSAARSTYWIYTSLTKAYVWDGASHTNITRQTAGNDVDYTAANTRDWNATLLGGVPILNNGTDDPQYWATLAPATKLVALANWPANTKAKIIRAFGPYLLALHPTISGTSYPHMVKWSHPADPGSVPISWDHTDPTKDAGEKDLVDAEAGHIVDGLPLGGRFFIYKEGSVWRVTQIGGTYIFDFGTSAFLETAGLLAPRCVTITGDGAKHVFASQDDILWHNGHQAESILDRRFRQYLQNNIDSVNYRNSFMITNPYTDEVWFCYPESGNEHPNKAIIWNYRRNALTEAEVNFRNAGVGLVENSVETWASVAGTWETYEGRWAENLRRGVVACCVDAGEFRQLEQTSHRDGEDFTRTLQRTGISVVGRKRNGEWIEDFKRQKMVTRVWIKASGSPFNVRLGSASMPGGMETWSAAVEFDPSTDNYVDIIASGATISIEFSSVTHFKIDGYKLEMLPLGNF